MVTLTRERRGEIADSFVRYMLAKKGFGLQPNDTKRELGNVAAATGVSKEELKAYFKPIVLELVEESLGA